MVLFVGMAGGKGEPSSRFSAPLSPLESHPWDGKLYEAGLVVKKISCALFPKPFPQPADEYFSPPNSCLAGLTMHIWSPKVIGMLSLYSSIQVMSKSMCIIEYSDNNIR